MGDEYHALIKNDTWELVPRTDKKTIGCKWVFRVKRKPDGSVDRYKARLVAKGYLQEHGRDYFDMFSPVTKPATIRIILSLALCHNWPLRQLDVNNAFLHGTMHEKVYIVQPLGNNTKYLDYFFARLGHTFSIKDLGMLHHFLGVEVVSTSSGIFLSKAQYIADILQQTKMGDAKPVHTPAGPKADLHEDANSSPSDSMVYRRVVGLLQYLSITRPDLSFTVNRLAQFMHSPTEHQWQAVKRVLWYLKGTTFHGLFLRRGTPLVLTAYSDSDWGGVHDGGKSTTGYVIYLGCNIISWRSVRQKSVARSSTEAEYRALVNTAAEVIWIQNLLVDLALDYFFVRDYVADGTLHVLHIRTKDQIANVLTKPLGRTLFRYFRSKLGVFDGSSILRGRDKA
ncbi:PREDICTED: uncharacterized protein LOC109155350 [Ipomoea nil]|uniref:uncharacterized protein LOC109155350 n=1 Tax=Ipomoea nil TaxID=35883 RepID=UPI0009015DB9|nr:PREDICTED: uncharacterized protein LOC109155350 [Ipomoea nil]